LEIFPENIKFVNGAYWLIRLRWIALSCLCVFAFFAEPIIGAHVNKEVFFIVAAILITENIISLIILKHIRGKSEKEQLPRYISWIINYQISLDLICLMALVYYSGGIENPLYMFCIFHMVISSILLKKKYSYLQTSIALLLLWTMAILEYNKIIPHHQMWLEWNRDVLLYNEYSYVSVRLIGFTFISYMLVYMSNYIVSLLHKQENAYLEANKLLKQQDKIKDDYILRVTHNIKGHLSVVQTNLSIINENVNSECEEKYKVLLDSAYNRSAKLTVFVNDLLKLTQMRLNDNMDIEEFSLKELLLGIIENIKKNAESKQINFIYHIDDKVEKIISNRFSIEELISNLLFNAIKYTHEKGVVELNVIDHKDKIIIDISDTGIGIPENELPNIFNEFYRASNAKNYEKDGTGLGLSMAKYITQRYGGEIKVTSKEGIGTRFTVVLPKSMAYAKEKSNKKKPIL
jgi:signal transduction histidine kinase